MSNERYTRRSIRDILNELIERTNSIIMRLRIVEQRNKTAMIKMNSIQDVSSEQMKESKKFTRSFEKRMTAHEEKITLMENMLKDMTKNINNAATRSELRGLEEMIKIYNPVKSQFVTKNELKRALSGGK